MVTTDAKGPVPHRMSLEILLSRFSVFLRSINNRGRSGARGSWTRTARGTTDRVNAEQKGLTFVYESGQGLPAGVHADEKRLRQVLINLLGNAIKFTERGSVHFRVSAEADNGRCRLQFEVEDTGRGIPDDELSRCYRRASLLAMPSRQEGFGLVYAEAMWHGIPCIGSTADAAREVIADGRTGLLVPYGDVEAIGAAVGALLREPERCRAMGDAGQREARERFGYPRFRDDVLRALDVT